MMRSLRILLFFMIPTLALAAPLTFASSLLGGQIGLSLPRSDYIRYADLAPSLSLFYFTPIGMSKHFGTRYDLRATFFGAANQRTVLAGQPSARYLREYGYSLNAGLLWRLRKARLIGRSLIPTILAQPGFYLMNTEIEISQATANAEPQREHQFMGRFGLRLGGSLEYFSLRNFGITMAVSFDIIPAFERGSATTAFKNNSHPARFWTLSLGVLIPVPSDDVVSSNP